MEWRACLRGVICPLLTPSRSDGSLDLDGATALVEWLAASGCVDGVFARSGMGRMFTFTVEETRRFGSAVYRAIGGRKRFLLGCGGEWLEKPSGRRPDSARYMAQAIDLTRFAEDLGADAAVHVIPEAITPGGGESIADVIFRYYEAVHAATALPLVIYQPSGTDIAYRMTPALLRRLLALPRIAGMKISTSDVASYQVLAEHVVGTEFTLICGCEEVLLDSLRAGASGVIGQGCTANPEILAAILRSYGAGDNEAAERAQVDAIRAVKAAEGLDGSMAMKHYLIHKGVPIQPYDRGDAQAYPPTVIERLVREIDSVRAPYLRAASIV